MEIILTEDVPKLGHAGDVVRVKDGYARNYLLPRGMALLATRGRVQELEHKKRMIDEKNRKEVGAHEAVARHLNTFELEFDVHASEEGKLFGSVTNSDIAGQLKERGVEVDRRKIDLPEPIKQVGEYTVSIRLHRQVAAEISVKVTSLDVPPPSDEEAEAGDESAEPQDEGPESGGESSEQEEESPEQD
jgi:large subunit ribosomal protein L9